MTLPAQRPSRGRRTPRLSGDERERAVLEAFERLLEDRPLHALSVDDIARGAGISRPTFYFYFASKEAVLLSLLERMLAEARAAREARFAALAEDDPERWRAGIASVYAVFRDHRAVTLAAADAQTTSEDVRALWSRTLQEWVDEATAGIESERERGAAPPGPPARALATSLVLMNERVLQGAVAGHTPGVDAEQALDVLLDVWMKAVYAR